MNKILLESGDYSDVTFIVGMKEGKVERINAHKDILSLSSPVFSSSLIGVKDQDEIRVTDVNPLAFKALLEFIYTEEYNKIHYYNWAPILYGAVKYKIDRLKGACIEYAEHNCNIKNVGGFFNQARKHQVEKLVPYIRYVIFQRTTEFLSSDSFFLIQDNESLNELFSCDQLDCAEINVFRAAMAWASKRINNGNEKVTGDGIKKVLGPAFYSIRFPQINPEDFNNEVIPKNILTDEEIVSILKKKTDDSIPFKWESRRRAVIISTCSYLLTRSSMFSIKFKVDCEVKIHSFGYIYGIGIWHGDIFLKEGESTILKENFSNLDPTRQNMISFTDPVIIKPNTWYLGEIILDKEFKNLYEGTKKQSQVIIDGIKWDFDHTHSQNISFIQFSKTSVGF